MLNSSAQDGRPTITARTIEAVFGGTGLESILDFGRCDVERPVPEDEWWSIRVRVGVLAQRPETTALTFMVDVASILGERGYDVVLGAIGSDDSWVEVGEKRLDPEAEQRVCSVVDLLFEAVCLWADTILERAIGS